MKKRVFSRGVVVSASALAIAMLGQAAAAQAQDAPEVAPSSQSTQDTAETRSEIIVTGSRLGRTSFDSPTPVNVVGQQRLENLAITNVGEALNQLPAFRALTTPASNESRSSATIAARKLDLRGLGTIRTLTLIDGKRHVAMGDDGNFDLNALPTNMINRSEVVTGGASAAYGAGAVAGVVNLILDTSFEGAKGELSYGLSEHGDARKVYGSMMLGTRFAGGRGRFVIGGEYSDEGGIGTALTRDWSRRFFDYLVNPFFSTDPALSNGLPATIAIDNVTSVLNPSGVVSNVHPFQGTQFDSNGNLIPFVFGDLFNPAKPSIVMVGGGSERYSATGSPLTVRTRHLSTLAHVGYELSDSLEVAAQLSFARVKGGPTGANPRTDQSGAIRINRDNAFLTPTVAAMMDAAGVAFIPVSRINYEQGANKYTSDNDVWRASFSVRGGLFADWSWDAFYQYGQTKGLQFNANSRIESRWFESIDAVRAPANIPGIAAGTIICRSTIENPTNGCIPANVMGPNKVSPASIGWSNTTAWSTRKFVQHQVAANVRGTLFEGWAGPIKAAFGVEYRADTSSGDNDPFSKVGAFSQLTWTFLPKTTQRVTEGYAEFNVPMFKDSALGKSLEIDGAIRRTHYSLSGDATTWKVGAVYEPNEEYMIRVTRSHDIRAPSPEELNPNTRVSNVSFDDPKHNIRYFALNTSGGNPNLRLESANTFTAGAVLKPNWLPRFKLSVDFYDIKVKDAIDIISAPIAVSLCRAGTNPGVCTIGTDSNGNPDRILALFATYQNVSQFHARGLEFISNYMVDLGGLDASLGTLDFMVNGSYVDTLTTVLPNGVVRQLAGETGNSANITNVLGVPKWRADAVVTYSKPTWSVTARMNYVPKSLLNRDWIGAEQEGYSPYLPNSVTYNHISARFYLDLSARAKLFGDGARKFELFGAITNVMDKDPPSELRLFSNSIYYNTAGRSYKVGVRAEW